MGISGGLDYRVASESIRSALDGLYAKTVRNCPKRPFAARRVARRGRGLRVAGRGSRVAGLRPEDRGEGRSRPPPERRRVTRVVFRLAPPPSPTKLKIHHMSRLAPR
jgi:hypothetical protein